MDGVRVGGVSLLGGSPLVRRRGNESLMGCFEWARMCWHFRTRPTSLEGGAQE